MTEIPDHLLRRAEAARRKAAGDDTVPLTGSFRDAAERIPPTDTAARALVEGMRSQVVRDVILNRLKKLKSDMTMTSISVQRALEAHSDLAQTCKLQSIEERELIAWLDENEVGWRNLLSSQDMDRIFGPEAMAERGRVRSYAGAVIHLADPQ